MSLLLERPGTEAPDLPLLEHHPPLEVIRWAVGEFGSEVVVAASMADAVLVDLAQRVDPNVRVVFVDTGFHFRETRQTLQRVRRRYPLVDVHTVGPAEAAMPLWRDGDYDGCCARNKVRPFEEALAGARAWISGLRRVDSPLRAGTPVVQWDAGRSMVKVNPIAAWSDEDVAAYIAAHDIIVNPLLDDGYLSIGCEPCTRRVAAGEEPRSGRWSDSDKTECGLHL